MRKQLCDALVGRANQDMVFISGDLGFMALEELRDVMGERFINAGVAEQNMVSVGAALSRQGYETWVYSIAPFCYARPFEQIRNDVAFHNLPVKLIGNGGGYGYGVMGPTHHALEDYGVLLSLPNFTAYVPVFDEDIQFVIQAVAQNKSPTYLRIGRGECPENYKIPDYAPWRQLTFGNGPVVISVGPLAGSYIEIFNNLPEAIRPNLWGVSELPIEKNPLPSNLLAQIKNTNHLCVAEEHVKRGSFGAELALYLMESGIQPTRYSHLYATNHIFDKYGSQKFLREQSGLDPEKMISVLGF